jgi:hypothetical protein
MWKSAWTFSPIKLFVDGKEAQNTESHRWRKSLKFSQLFRRFFRRILAWEIKQIEVITVE